jgi:radical SAM protein with 4Fe4S-binding SPASM domain
MHRDFPEMARELKDANVCEKMWLKTNGLLLRKGFTERISRAGFDMIGISVIAPHENGYKRLSGSNMDYKTFVGNVRELFERRQGKIYIKMADVGFSPEEIQKFYDDFEPISDFISVENLHGWSRMDLKDFTLGTKPVSFDGLPNKKRTVCAWTLYQLTINWNGTVQPCNEDWSRVNIMGDINKHSLPSIWTGKTFNEFRRMQLSGERFSNTACGSCWQTMSQMDDVDPYRKMMLEKFNGK